MRSILKKTGKQSVAQSGRRKASLELPIQLSALSCVCSVITGSSRLSSVIGKAAAAAAAAAAARCYRSSSAAPRASSA